MPKLLEAPVTVTNDNTSGIEIATTEDGKKYEEARKILFQDAWNKPSNEKPTQGAETTEVVAVPQDVTLGPDMESHPQQLPLGADSVARHGLTQVEPGVGSDIVAKLPAPVFMPGSDQVKQ